MEKTKNKKQSQWAEVFRMLKKNKMAMLGLIILIILVILALFADFIANYDTIVIKQNLAERLMPPSGKHWLGTDEFGRDILARLIHGARVSLKVGILAISISAEIDIAKIPTFSETLAPWISLASISLPNSSVPNQCFPLGGISLSARFCFITIVS